MTTGKVLINIKIIVGFGDFFPRTVSGRIVITLTAIWGMFIVSMFVYTIQVST
jgi:hypothetical protein